MIKILEPLRKYAIEAPGGMLPETFPWDRDDAWGLYGVSRAALGL